MSAYPQPTENLPIPYPQSDKGLGAKGISENNFELFSFPLLQELT